MGERKVGDEAVQVHTPGGVVEVRWDERGTATAMGQLAFFAEYLEARGLFEGWLQSCPLKYSSPNAPKLVDAGSAGSAACPPRARRLPRAGGSARPGPIKGG